MNTVALDHKQREAVLDVLVLAICVDGFFSLTEDEKFRKKISDLGWETDSECSHSLSLSLARARGISESKVKIDQYLDVVSSYLKEEGLTALVLEKTEKILEADGLNTEESSFLESLKKALGLTAIRLRPGLAPPLGKQITIPVFIEPTID